MMSELFLYGMIAATPLFLSRGHRFDRYFLLLGGVLFAGMMLALVMMVGVNSIRIIFIPVFSFFIAIMHRKKNASIWTAVVVVFSMQLSSPIMQIVRYIGNPGFNMVIATEDADQKSDIAKQTLQKNCQIIAADGEQRNPGVLSKKIVTKLVQSGFHFQFFFQNIASTFGLSDHLAVYLNKIDPPMFFGGGDRGKSWLYNAAFSFIPRSIWSDKPLQYGSVAIQKWLYPDMFIDQEVTMTLPPGFALDFIFPFGILGGLLMCFVFGKGLGKIRQILWDCRNANDSMFSLAICVMAFMFNWVRGGTGNLISVYLTVLMTMLIYGAPPFLKPVWTFFIYPFHRDS